MKLNELVYNKIAETDLGDYAKLTVKGLSTDSRAIKAGYVFFASHTVLSVEGGKYIGDAVQRGAIAVLCESEPVAYCGQWLLDQSVPVVRLESYLASLGDLASRYYGHPSRSLRVIGVTGTNGKTSVSYLTAQALSALGCPCGLIGTLGHGIVNSSSLGALAKQALTTPDVIHLHSLLAELRDQGAKAVVMEVSSHGLVQQRVAGVQFYAAIFTNLTHDHLDYHGNMKNYGAAKRLLFGWPGLKYCLINRDDAFGRELIDYVRYRGEAEVYEYGCEDSNLAESCSHSALMASLKSCNILGLSADISSPWGNGVLKSCLLGRFNVSNMLAVLGMLCLMGISLKECWSVVAKLRGVPGRMQRFGGNQGLPIVVLDYAHTPDALLKVLQSLRDLLDQNRCLGKLWCVFGCGGDRDAEKRPLMGDIAGRYSDCVVLTNDNPRMEEPEAIVKAIQSGMSQSMLKRTQVILDRASAIKFSLNQARSSDIVLVAGKGHEDYQIIGNKRYYLSDAEVIERVLDEALFV